MESIYKGEKWRESSIERKGLYQSEKEEDYNERFKVADIGNYLNMVMTTSRMVRGICDKLNIENFKLF